MARTVSASAAGWENMTLVSLPITSMRLKAQQRGPLSAGYEALGAYSNIILAIGCADSRQDVVFAYEKPSAADAAGKHIYGRSAEELRYEHIYGLIVNLLRPAYLLYHA